MCGSKNKTERKKFFAVHNEAIRRPNEYRKGTRERKTKSTKRGKNNLNGFKKLRWGARFRVGKNYEANLNLDSFIGWKG